jgi:hypothetical protein
MNRKLPLLVALATLLGVANASAGIITAANLSWTPATSSGAVGDLLVFTVFGSGFSTGTSGGDFAVEWDPAHLAFVSLENAEPLIFDSFSSDLSLVSSGLIARVDVFKNSAGTVSDFDIATLTMQVLAGLASVDSTTLKVVAVPPPLGVGWFEAGGTNPFDVTYGTAQASATTVIPAPPAAWLLLTAIGGLAARRWRRA